MQLTSEDREVIILLKYAGLKPDQANVLAVALNAYFSEALTFAESMAQLNLDLNLNEAEIKKIILAGGVLYYSKLDQNLQDDIYIKLEENSIDYLALKKELFETEGKIVFDDELISAEFDDREAMINVFKNNLQQALTSTLPDNRHLLDETLIQYLLAEGVVFQADLIKALKANQEKIGQQNITLNGQSTEPTIANWLTDFEANNLISVGNTARAQYFNNSKNYQALAQIDKNFIIQLLDVYAKIKNFAQYFVKEETENWHIIPLLANEVELRKKEKIDDVKYHYENDLEWLKEKYHFKDNLPKYQNLTVQELLSALDSEPQNTEVVLPVLEILNVKDPSFENLKNSNFVSRISKGEFYPSLKGFQEKPLFRQILDICELSSGESALFIMHLASTNKNLIGLSYADLKENAFKWR